MFRTLRLLLFGAALLACCGCTARDWVYAFFGGAYHAGEGLSTEERRLQFEADAKHWDDLSRAESQR